MGTPRSQGSEEASGPESLDSAKQADARWCEVQDVGEQVVPRGLRETKWSKKGSCEKYSNQQSGETRRKQRNTLWTINNGNHSGNWAEIPHLRFGGFLNPRGELIPQWTVQPGQEIESAVLRIGGEEAGTGGGWWVRFGGLLCGAVRQWGETRPGAGFGHRSLRGQGSKKKEKSLHCWKCICSRRKMAQKIMTWTPKVKRRESSLWASLSCSHFHS